MRSFFACSMTDTARRQVQRFVIHLCHESLLETRRFKLTPDSAALIVNIRWMSGGTRTINLPLKGRVDIGSGTGSLFFFKSETVFRTSFRIPCSDFSGVFSSQLRLENSAHRPTYSSSSSDQVTLYVNLSIFLPIFSLYSLYCQ